MKTLIEEYLDAKALESAATAKRVELGNQIAQKLAQLATVPDDKSKTFDVDGYKLTVKQPINRRVDWDAFDVACAKHPGVPIPATVKRSLDEPGLRWVKEHNPAFYLSLSKAITAQPGRVQITVKEAKKS